MSLFWRSSKPRRSAGEWFPLPAGLTSEAASYADVNVSTVDTAMQAVAVRASVDLIASLVSELPVDVYTERGGQRRQVPIPGYLLDPAGDGQGLSDWIYQALVSWLLRGNVHGEILDLGPGDVPRQVVLAHPDRVTGQMREDGSVQWYFDGKPIAPSRVWHKRVNPVPGCVLGMSVIQAHAYDIGLNIVLTRFGLDYFRDGAHPSAVLQNTEKEVGEQLARQVKDRFLAALRGRREPVVFGRGWKFDPIQITPEESQFLETRGFTAAECCRLFGPGIAEILGYQQTGATLTYANLQSRTMHLMVFALDKWIRRVERMLTSMLPVSQYAKLNRDAVLETTTLERYQAHALALQNKWKVVNEVRRDEDLEPVEWGDEPVDLQAQEPAPEPPTEEDDQPPGTGGRTNNQRTR